MLEDGSTADEQHLLERLRDLAGEGLACSAAVVLDQGRLFTPGPWPGLGMPKRSPFGSCHRNALRVARSTGGAYVEGFALANGRVLPHAWCLTAGQVLDATWPDGTAQALVGVAVTVAYVEAVQQRTCTRTAFPGILDTTLQWNRDAGRIFEYGIPDWALADTRHHPSTPKAG
ncbi:hypothetical protein [Kitasatospora sp. LaBMicrA B282]|uniref:hypothetical protein n=1 Tax=Kitasatospora sp. LaBMicrA B282 TaxID=3420949 RepID=UPI003D0BDB57